MARLKPPCGAAIRTGPGDSVTGHAPEVLFHAIGTDHETAGA